MKLDVSDFLALIGLLLALFTGICTLFSGLMIWYANTKTRRLALDRDLNHLKGNYEQIIENLRFIISEMDHRLDSVDRTLVEINSFLNIQKK